MEFTNNRTVNDLMEDFVDTLQQRGTYLTENHNNGISTRQCTINIRKPDETSYDSFTWLIEKKNYYWALDIQNLNNDYEFIFNFLINYFAENLNDYLRCFNVF